MIILSILALAIIVLRLRTYDEPPEPDLCCYMIIGHTMVRGGSIYDDAYDIRPPGSFVIYALAELVAGYGQAQLFLLNVGAAIATLLGVYVAGATRGRMAGLWAAMFWVLLCGAPSLQANQPNGEVFINSLVVWSLALLLRGFGSSRGTASAVVVGVLFAIGTLIKQIVIIDALLLSCPHVVFATGLPGRRRGAIRDVAIIALVGAISWVLVIGYFSATGRHEIFWINTFKNAVAYAGNPLFNLYRYVREGRFLPPTLWFAIPIMALILLGLIRDRHTAAVRPWVFTWRPSCRSRSRSP